MSEMSRRMVAILVILVLLFSLTSCGANKVQEEVTITNANPSIVNIGATDSLGTVNPLNMDWTFIDLYALSIMFLPLMAFTDDANVEGILAESVTTKDNITFHITLKDDVYWSDGEPVTVDDVIFTILRLTSPEVRNCNFLFSVFEGFDEDGISPSGAEEIEGIVKIDDKNMEFVAKSQLSLQTFINNVCTWICILPEHVLKDVPADELSTYEWFEHPDVVDGPYRLEEYDPAEYILYSANDSYYLGRPKIDQVKIKIMSGEEILDALSSGEIDFVQPSMCSVPLEDWNQIESLKEVNVTYTDAACDQLTLINTANIQDARVRQAILYSIDRQTIIDQVLQGHGEIIDGFVCPMSPYYDETKTVCPYDPQKAKDLLEESDWDTSEVIDYYVNSGDSTMVKAAQMIEQYMEAVGFTVQVHEVDFATLVAVAGSKEVDMFTVQYTITPDDYYGDIYGLVNMENSWSGGFFSEVVDEALAQIQFTNDIEELTRLYRVIDDVMISQVPMFSLYFISNLGVVSKRLVNATPSVYGAFRNIEEWEITE